MRKPFPRSVVRGAEDLGVNINQERHMSKALKLNKKEVLYLEKEKDGNHFSSNELHR